MLPDCWTPFPPLWLFVDGRCCHLLGSHGFNSLWICLLSLWCRFVRCVLVVGLTCLLMVLASSKPIRWFDVLHGSVIVAPGFHAAWTPGSLSVLGASYLPGLCQTAFRAELFAVAFAVHCAADAGTPVRIWTDCLGVLTKYNLLVHGHVKLNPNRSNSDLWAWVLQSVDRLGSQYIQLHKVPAHRTLQSAKTKQQAWMFFHNDYADRAARLANQARPTSFWDVWEQHSQAVVVAEGLFQQVQLLHLAVGRRQVQSSVIETGEPAPALVRPTRSFTPQFCLGTWNGQLLPKTGRLFGAALMQKLCKWFLARLVPVQGDNIVWLSFTQMYLDFQMTWGHPGPVKVQKQWVDAETRPYLAVEQFPFRVRVRWFRQFVKHFIQEAGLTVALEQCRPKSMLLQAYLPAASVPWDARILAELEDWLGAHLSEPCVRSADALRCLPIARRQSSFQVWPAKGALVAPPWMSCLAPTTEQAFGPKSWRKAGGLEYFLCFHILGRIIPTD